MTIEEDEGNQDVFRECLSSVLITSLTQPSKASKGKRATKGRKNAIKPVDKPSDAAANDAEELSEFIEVSLPTPPLPSQRASDGDCSSSPWKSSHAFLQTCALSPSKPHNPTLPSAPLTICPLHWARSSP